MSYNMNEEPNTIECMGCDLWYNRSEREGYADWVAGRCRPTGLQTPPRHCCGHGVPKRKRREDEE